MLKIVLLLTAFMSAIHDDFDFMGYWRTFKAMDNLSEYEPPKLILRANEANKLVGTAFTNAEEANKIIRKLGYDWRSLEQTTEISLDGTAEVVRISPTYFSFYDQETGEDLWPKYTELIRTLENVQIHIRQSPRFDENYRDATIFIFGTHGPHLIVGIYELIWS